MKRSINKTSVFLLLSVFMAVSFVACNIESKEKYKTENKKTQNKKTTPKTYETIPVKSINPAYHISLPARLKPYEQAALYAKVEGFVKKMYVDRGSKVHKGQLLAVLEAQEINQQYLSDRSSEKKLYNDYLYALQAYERLKKAATTEGAVAAIELDRAKSKMESTEAAYKASKAKAASSEELKKYLRITAPFDGIISERNVSVGALVGKTSNIPLFELVQEDYLRMTLLLPEKYAGSVQKDMTATFTVSSRPGKIFHARLSRYSGVIHPEEHALTLEFDVENKKGILEGGDYAQVKVKLQRSYPTLWIPNSSILSNQEGTFVYIRKDNRIKRISVKEGIRLDSLTEVFGQLNTNHHIIVHPSPQIQEGIIHSKTIHHEDNSI